MQLNINKNKKNDKNDFKLFYYQMIRDSFGIKATPKTIVEIKAIRLYNRYQLCAEKKIESSLDGKTYCNFEKK